MGEDHSSKATGYTQEAQSLADIFSHRFCQHIFVNGITIIFHRKFYAERNKCFFKSNFTEKGFVDFNRVKSSITKKSLRGDKRMLLKEINQNKKQGL